MIQKITFATILVAFSVFFICFTNASPIEYSPRSSVAFADFLTLAGRVSFHEFLNNDNVVVVVSGQFSYGFTDATSKYEIQIPHLKKQLILHINPPGTSPFEYVIEGKTLKFFIEKKVKVFRDGEVLVEERIVSVPE
ncbi:hypothetical protein Glove_219g143 [Diversispora epigaea]|uniref:Uncharacterized protein n=1 Tax=Diversispora epigaea TaxID=1348612 RepID=A0A397IQ64_9GLOM|nr:hypothetical protein Glove_219g143 [Diversispora epigaea]